MKKTRKPWRKRPVSVTIPPSRVAEFPEVKGKTIAELKLHLELDDTSLALLFTDKTYLSFDLEPNLTIRADLSDWKTHNYRRIKRWRPLQRKSSWDKW
jgi:hypothetical protein